MDYRGHNIEIDTYSSFVPIPFEKMQIATILQETDR